MKLIIKNISLSRAPFTPGDWWRESSRAQQEYYLAAHPASQYHLTHPRNRTPDPTVDPNAEHVEQETSEEVDHSPTVPSNHEDLINQANIVRPIPRVSVHENNSILEEFRIGLHRGVRQELDTQNIRPTRIILESTDTIIASIMDQASDTITHNTEELSDIADSITDPPTPEPTPDITDDDTIIDEDGEIVPHPEVSEADVVKRKEKEIKRKKIIAAVMSVVLVGLIAGMGGDAGSMAIISSEATRMYCEALDERDPHTIDYDDDRNSSDDDWVYSITDGRITKARPDRNRIGDRARISSESDLLKGFYHNQNERFYYKIVNNIVKHPLRSEEENRIRAGRNRSESNDYSKENLKVLITSIKKWLKTQNIEELVNNAKKNR